MKQSIRLLILIICFCNANAKFYIHTNDIDIVTCDKTKLEPLFEKFIKRKQFTKLESQERKANSFIDKAHYKFYYRPVYKTAQEEEYILLDILFKKYQYQKIILIDIDSSFEKWLQPINGNY